MTMILLIESLFHTIKVISSKKRFSLIKIEIYNEERENNPMLCFSSTDPNVCQIEDKYQKAELIK